jgi:hypothetical protein
VAGEAESVMGKLLFGTMITIFIVSPALARQAVGADR